MSKPLYKIIVEKRKDTEFALFASKCYGDGLGVAVTYDSPQKVINEIQRHVKRWGEFDGILNRVSDPVSEANTLFESNTVLVSKSLVFCPSQKTLECFSSSDKKGLETC